MHGEVPECQANCIVGAWCVCASVEGGAGVLAKVGVAVRTW
jgi:hypothetical protein